MKLSFTKMQGCANDYIYLDCRESGVPEQIVPLAQKLSRRHFSIGADGIICICAPDGCGRGRRHAHLQRRRQRGADVRQRRALCGPVALHPCSRVRREGDAGASTPSAAARPLPIRARACGRWRWALTPPCAAALPAVHMGEGPAGGPPPDRGGQDVACHLHQRGQPPLRHRGGGCGQPEAGGHRPGVRAPRKLPGAGEHRVRARWWTPPT